MKIASIFVVILILMVVGFMLYSWLNRPQQTISPIHENDGVKVIYETPTQ